LPRSEAATSDGSAQGSERFPGGCCGVGAVQRMLHKRPTTAIRRRRITTDRTWGAGSAAALRSPREEKGTSRRPISKLGSVLVLLGVLGVLVVHVPGFAGENELLWAKRAGGLSEDEARAVAGFADGSIVVVGHFEGTSTFGAGEAGETQLVAAGSSDVFVAKYNADGTLAWAKRAGGFSNDYGYGVAALSDGTCVVTGSFYSAATFGKGEANDTDLTSNGNYDLFAARYNADGTLAWARGLGNLHGDEGRAVAALSDDTFVITGHFQDSVTFGSGEATETTLNSSGGSDVFLARYNPDGTLVWARKAGGTSWDYGVAITRFANDTVAITGNFQGTATFGPGEGGQTVMTSAGIVDIFVARYNTDGSLAWAKRAGGNRNDYGNGIAALPDGSVAVIGNFITVDSPAVFGPGEAGETGLTSAGGSDIFLAKFAANGTLAWVKQAGGTSWEYGQGVAALPDGSAVATGYFKDTATFGSGETNETDLTSDGDYDVFTAKFAGDGTLTNAKRGGGTGDDRGYAVAATSTANAMTVGFFEGAATFGSGEATETELISAGDTDVFIVDEFRGDIVFVDKDATGANDGSRWADAYTDLQDGLAAGGAGAEIWVAEGTYRPTTDSDRTVSFTLKDGVSIYGGFAGTETLLTERDVATNTTTLSGDIGTPGDSSDNSYHVVRGTTGGTLDGFTVSGGNANSTSSNGYGGGMYNNSASPAVSDCTFLDNSAGYWGGGMYNQTSSPVVTACTFSGNSAVNGGAIANRSSSDGQISECTFTGNSAGGNGGAIALSGSSPEISGTTFSTNTATGHGGALYATGSSAQISGCTFDTNSASQYGGALACYGGSDLAATNCLFAGNSAAYWGGGVHNSASDTSAVNCTFYDNTAGRGGALSNAGSSPTIRNCILWANTGTLSDNQIRSDAGSSPAVSYSCVQNGYSGTGNISSDPQFADAASGDFHVKSQEGRWNGSGWSTDATTSPCIDAGDPGDNYDSEPEDNGDRVNMGAFGATSQASKSFAGEAPGAPAPPFDPDDDEESEEWQSPQQWEEYGGEIF